MIGEEILVSGKNIHMIRKSLIVFFFQIFQFHIIPMV